MAVVATPSWAAEAVGTRLPKHRTSAVAAAAAISAVEVTLAVAIPAAVIPVAVTAASTTKSGQDFSHKQNGHPRVAILP
jgi:hypothetical protein